MSISALTLESTLQVVEWGDDGGVTNPAPAGQIRHVDVTGVAVINDPANGLKYTKVVAGVFVAMSEAERTNVDNLTPSSDVQRIIRPGPIITDGTGWQSIFTSPREARPVVAGDWELTACFAIKMANGPTWDAGGADSAAEARLLVNGTVRRPWILPMAFYSTHSGCLSDNLADGVVLTIDFQTNRKGASGDILVEDVELVLKRIDHHVHDDVE